MISVVDDGVQVDHPDLSRHYLPEASWDFNRNVSDPSPQSADDAHGTRCAGTALAGANDFCGVGVAYNASLAAIRLLGEDANDVQEALALSHRLDLVDMYSCSWGPSDDGRTVEGPSVLTNATLAFGTRRGRGGKGALYIYASGNGGQEDGCNFDGYANSPFTITTGALAHDGTFAPYQEICSAQLVTMYSGGRGQYVQTSSSNLTCTSPPCCYSTFGGTSAAAPMLAGTLALVLQVR